MSDALPAGCDLQADSLAFIPADFDWDEDVDAADFAFIKRHLSGPGDRPSRACRG